MYRLLLTDLDDTLLNSKGKISDENRTAIQAAMEKGCNVAICSGRSNMALKRFNDYLGIKGYTIGYNGGIIYSNSEVLACHYLDKELVSDIIRYCKKMRTNVQIYQKNGLWIDRTTFFTRQYCKKQGFKANKVDSLLNHLTDEINKVIILASPRRLRKIEKNMPQSIRQRCCTFFSHKYLFEFNPLNITKGSALTELAQLLEIPIEEVIAVGDHENDIDMIKAAGLGVAVRNAIPELMDIADYVTESTCDNSPIAEIINKFVLQEEE